MAEKQKNKGVEKKHSRKTRDRGREKPVKESATGREDPVSTLPPTGQSVAPVVTEAEPNATPVIKLGASASRGSGGQFAHVTAAPSGMEGAISEAEATHVEKISNKIYEAELYRLQGELVKLQRWVKATGARVVIIFEGRDAAGKGGTIKRITEYMSPRVARVVALPTPTEREKSQWYFQRYIQHLPAAGEIVLFDRSWYNRAGVEKVMGFATGKQVQEFMRQCPIFEQMLVEDGIYLRKYWFSVSDEVQYERFQSRLNDPLRQWKLSPMDLESITRWEDYSRAKDDMMVHTDTAYAPWHHVLADSKKQARLNMISHLLESLPYYDIAEGDEIKLPKRPKPTGYQRPPVSVSKYVPDRASQWVAEAKERKAKRKAKGQRNTDTED